MIRDLVFEKRATLSGLSLEERLALKAAAANYREKLASVQLEARMAGGRIEPLLNAERDAVDALGTGAKRVGGLPKRQPRYVRESMYAPDLDNVKTEVASKVVGALTDVELPPEVYGAAKEYIRKNLYYLKTGKD